MLGMQVYKTFQSSVLINQMRVVASANADRFFAGKNESGTDQLAQELI